MTGHAEAETDATHFIPSASGKLEIKGLEDDRYTMTEVRTDNAYTLLKDSIRIVISSEQSDTLCSIYGTDVLGLLQNDPRYANVDPGLYHNMPQKHLGRLRHLYHHGATNPDGTLRASGLKDELLHTDGLHWWISH